MTKHPLKKYFPQNNPGTSSLLSDEIPGLILY